MSSFAVAKLAIAIGYVVILTVWKKICNCFFGYFLDEL